MGINSGYIIGPMGSELSPSRSGGDQGLGDFRSLLRSSSEKRVENEKYCRAESSDKDYSLRFSCVNLLSKAVSPRAWNS